MSTIDPVRPAVAAPPSDGVSVRPRAAGALVLALVAAVALTAAALWTAGGQQLDQEAMRTVAAGREARLTVLSILGRVSIGAIAVVALTCVGLALLRGRVRLAAAAAVVIVGANASTQLLKHTVLERSEFVGGLVAHNSLPSGHTTVVAASFGALCLVAPPFARTLIVAAGAAAVTLTGASTVVAGWHRPADVAVAVVVALVWTAAAAAVVGGDARGGAGGFVAATCGSVLAVLFLIGIGVRPAGGVDNVLQAGLVLGGLAAVTTVMAWATDRISPRY